MSIALLKKIVRGILGIIGASIILLLTIHQSIGILPDSVAYISVARNLTEGAGFVTFEGNDFVLQPPLYPLLLASIKEVSGIDPIVSAGYLNSLLFGLIIYLFGLLLSKHIKSFTLVILGTVFVLISFALVQASLLALSETLFIFLVLLFLYFIEQYQSKKDLVSLLLFSISAALACLTRYTSVIIILTGIICIILWGRKNIKEKVWHLLSFMGITVIPISIWIIRNYILTGTLVGFRAASTYTLFENLRFFYSTVLSWYFPINFTFIYLIFILLIITIWILFGLDPMKSLNKEGIKIISPSLLFVLLYSGIIIISSTTTAYDRINDRLLSPIYIPIIFIVFFIFDKIFSWLAKYFNAKLITALFIIGMILIIINPIKNTIEIIKDDIELSGWGYSCEAWRKNETVDYLKQHEQFGKNYVLYSNEPEAVYILTNLKTRRSPSKTFYNSQQLYKNILHQMDIWMNENKICLIWFDDNNRSFLFTIDELKKNKIITEVARLKDGKIYTCSNK